MLGPSQECREYLRNLRKRFGQDAVVVPTTAKDFDGNMDALFNAMFPQVKSIKHSLYSNLTDKNWHVKGRTKHF